MKRSESRRGSSWLTFHLGDLERYGVLALAACLVLGVAYLMQTVNGAKPRFERIGFSGDRVAEELTDLAPPAPHDQEVVNAASRPDPIAADAHASDAKSGDEPGGGEVAIAPVAPPRPRRVGSRRADFDFFEPPVKVAGKPAPLAPPPPGSNEEARIVVVQKGDTLQKIAARELGDASRWRVLTEWNPGLDPKRLKSGQELRLPPPTRAAPARVAAATRLHEVAADDTLQSLAERYYGDRARWIDLLEANRDQLRGPADLKIGSKIRIP
jgi:nucleoid-associated protein YgaU